MKENYCSTCGQMLKPGELTVRCRLCMRNYHAGCWEKTGGCTTWGCAGRPQLADEDEKIAYKRCPYCGEKIISFATRCRYCRSDLESQDSALQKKPLRKEKRDYYTSEPVYRKDPILTSLLNLIFPGAGYMYLGLFSKGLLWFLVAVGAWFFARGLGLIAVYVWVMYDSARQAVQINKQMSSNDSSMRRPGR